MEEKVGEISQARKKYEELYIEKKKEVIELKKRKSFDMDPEMID